VNRAALQSIGLVVLKLLALAFGYFVILVFLSFVWVIYQGIQRFPESLDAAQSSLQVFSGVIFLAALARFYRKRGMSLKQAAGLVKTGLTKSEYAMFAAFGIALNLFVVTLLNLLPLSVTVAYRVDVQEAVIRNSALMSIVTIMIYAPVMEEIIFRGLCLRYLRACATPYKAAAWCSVLFGLVHAQPVWIVYAILMGMVFSVITIREGSIVPAIVTHFTFNATSLAAFFIAVRSGPDWSFGLSVPILLLILAAAAALSAVLGIKLYKLTGRDHIHGT
jgi:membrane protease YdiL (CAAX protease family)